MWGGRSVRCTQWGPVKAYSLPLSGLPSEWTLVMSLSVQFVNDVFLICNSARFDVARISLFGGSVVEAWAFVPGWQSLRNLVLQSWCTGQQQGSAKILSSFPQKRNTQPVIACSLLFLNMRFSNIPRDRMINLTHSFKKYFIKHFIWDTRITKIKRRSSLTSGCFHQAWK